MLTNKLQEHKQNNLPIFFAQNGYTPLHQAAQQGNTHIVNVLLQHGAKPNTTTVVRNEKC